MHQLNKFSYLKEVTPRLYQETIFSTCSMKNTLVVLPTGMGKTMIAMMLSAQRLQNFPKSKVLVLAPTKPLVEQHYTTFSKQMNLETGKMVVFTGMIRPAKREMMWKDARVIFSTPQGLENDIISNRIKLEDVSLVVFDEAHRATGDYAYTFISKQYDKKAKYPRVLALTASPGSDLEQITDVCKNLHIEDVELRTDSDPDVKPYIQEVSIVWEKVDLDPSLKSSLKYLKDCYKSKLKEVQEYGYCNSTHLNGNKMDILKLQRYLHMSIAKGERNPNIMKSVSLLAEAMKVQHAVELLETQGVSAVNDYMERIMIDSTSSKVKAVQNLARDLNFKSALILVRRLHKEGVEHPKMERLREVIERELTGNKKVIIFSQYRDSAKKIVDKLNNSPGIKAKLFVGQMKKGGTGLSQKEQKAVLDEFRNDEFNALVATSVAEEGLDIPCVDSVVFYEPVPSGIRTIQRRGRTGRTEKGKVIILMTKGTRDEGFKWSAHHKEKRMYRHLESLKGKFTGTVRRKDDSLKKYLAPELDIKTYVDFREKGSGVIKELIELGINVEMKKLEVGDYILSSRVGVEFKTVKDFVDSLIDGRLLVQMKELKENFERPIVILEGDENIFSQRNIHPNAIRGVLSMIAVSYGIPIIQTKDAVETAAQMAVIAKREKEESNKPFSAHTSKKPTNLKELQEYLVSALPGVGPTLSKPLLQKFGSVINVMVAHESLLRKVDKVGEKKAKEIRKVLDSDYNKSL